MNNTKQIIDNHNKRILTASIQIDNTATAAAPTIDNYLADRLSYQSHSRNLRSSSRQLLGQPRSFTKTYGNRAFSVCAPKLWNSLPLDLRKSPSLTSFKKGLKTYLLRKFLEIGTLFL